MNEQLQPEELNLILRRNIVARRKELGYSQHELGRRAGMPASNICLIEAGRKNPSMKTLASLATALETTPATLLTPNAFLSRQSEKVVR